VLGFETIERLVERPTPQQKVHVGVGEQVFEGLESEDRERL